MANQQTFRSAFNGFNRDDVVRCLEYLNTKHQNQVNQMTSEAEALRAQLEELQQAAQFAQTRLQDVTQERDALRAQLEELQRQSQEGMVREDVPENLPDMAAKELEAYRRAERVERVAREKAELVYHQVSGVLNEAAGKVDGITLDITARADQVMSQLTQLQAAICASKQSFQEASSVMNVLRPQLKNDR